MNNIVVLKFGGSSVSTAVMMSQAVHIVSEQAKTKSVMCVVSALGGVTNRLIELSEKAAKQDFSWKTAFEEIKKRHLDQAEALHIEIAFDIEPLFGELYHQLKTIEERREVSPKELDSIVSFGERFSVRMFARALEKKGLNARFKDTLELIKTDSNFGDALVDLEISVQKLRLAATEFEGITVFTGFIATDREGNITTLGRSGSDFTAGLVGYSVDADWVEIWTDVDGVFTTDPNVVNQAVLIPELTYDFMEIMADNGAKVLHPRTVRPLQLKHIPILIKNTFNPGATGTWVRTQIHDQHEAQDITTVSLRKNQCFLSTEKLHSLELTFTENQRKLLENKALQVGLGYSTTGFVLENGVNYFGEICEKVAQLTVLTTGEFYPKHIDTILEQLAMYSIPVLGYVFEHAKHVSFIVEEKHQLNALKIIHKHYCL